MKKKKFLMLYFILLPVIDVVTSLTSRMTDFPISLGMIVKCATMLFIFFYIVFFSKSKWKKKSLLFTFIYSLLCILYLITKPNILNVRNLFVEFSYLLKFSYFPFTLIGMLNIFDDYKVDSKFIKVIIIMNSALYSLFCIVPSIFNVGFGSYSNTVYTGNIGWFYSANEMCVVLLLLSTSIYIFLKKNFKIGLLYSIIILTAIINIGTKVSFIGTILMCAFIVILYVVEYGKKGLVNSLVFLVVSSILLSFSPVINNTRYNFMLKNSLIQNRLDGKKPDLKNNSESNNSEGNNSENNNSEKKYCLEYQEVKYDVFGKYVDLIDNNILIKTALSGREEYLGENLYSYKHGGSITLLLGTGWNDRDDINFCASKQMVEMDFFDILIHFGSMYIVMYLSFIFYVLFYLLKRIKKLKKENYLLIFLLLLVFGISTLSGHVLGAPTVSIYLSLILSLLIMNTEEAKNHEKNSSLKEYLKYVYNKSEKEYFELLSKFLKNNEKKFIITANPETLTMAETDKEISKMLLDENNSVVPDGIAIVKACKMLNIPVTERIAGVDIAEYLLKEAAILKKKIYLFGSKQEVIDGMKKVIEEKYSGIKLVGATNGYIEDKDKEFENIKKAKPDVVMVALGIPHQEKLIYKHLNEFDKGIFIGVGGSFDVLSGTKKRAPKLFIKTNTEWLYRIVSEPKRLKRFWNNNVKFIFKVWKER